MLSRIENGDIGTVIVKDTEDKDRWIINEEAAAVVRRIFAMTVEGMEPYRIAKILSDEKVEKPLLPLQRN